MPRPSSRAAGWARSIRAKDTRLDRVVALKILPAHLATNPERRQRFDGPLTVPQIAQMRPTSRQRMQRLADELAAEGLVEFIDNPGHRRSKRCGSRQGVSRAIAC